ncbi:MAG: glycosyltransferase, partial [Anaerolineales bacterium]|nr:glycosyltransferase [Anaerolineales bacterium]
MWTLKPEIVISESPLAPLPLGRYRLFHMIHDAKFATVHGRSKRQLVRMVHWLSARIADGVLTVSLSEKNRLMDALGLPEDHIRISYNGVSNEWLEMDRTDHTPLRYDLIYVSNFARHKGHMHLLQAIRRTSYTVIFIGADFGEMDRCKKAAADWDLDVTFVQDLSEAALIRLYDQSRVFVFPSKLEGFGMPYLEARARGLPIVANDIPIFHELQQIAGGHIVDFTDSERVRSCLVEAMMLNKEVHDLDGFQWSDIA